MRGRTTSPFSCHPRVRIVQHSKVTTDLAAVQADLASTEDEWLALSAQLEIAEG